MTYFLNYRSTLDGIVKIHLERYEYVMNSIHTDNQIEQESIFIEDIPDTSDLTTEGILTHIHLEMYRLENKLNKISRR